MLYKKTALRALAIGLFAAFFTVQGYAAAPDKYAPVYHQPLKASSLKDPVSYLLAMPFEVLRWPADQSLLFVEKEQLHKKAEWLYSYLKNHGIHPSAGYSSGGGIHAGLKLDLPRLTSLKGRYPDFVWDVWVNYSSELQFQTGTEIGLERIAGTSFFASGIFQYEKAFEEDFYGIGPDSSRGEGVSFEQETTTVGGKGGYEFSPTLKSTGYLTYRNVNISEGDDNGRGQLERFELDKIPGLRGDKILTMAADLKHDTRDFTDAPTQGGYRHIYAGYNEGLGDSDARYFTYRADIAQYFKIKSPRRVAAFRGLIEHNDEINGGYVPFYNMSKLGGYGALPSSSSTLRGYDKNRFFGESLVLFNFEYRYTIWEYRDLMMDAVPFFDIGQVFGEFSDFKFSDFRESYGLEFRWYIARNNLLNVSVAHGDEGTNLFIRTKKAF